MPQSEAYQPSKDKFLLKDEQTKILEGKLEKAQALIFRLLMRRIGAVSPELQIHIKGFSLYQLEALDEALFDFTEARDLVRWLLENNEASKHTDGYNNA